jgi:hypothetical protein
LLVVVDRVDGSPEYGTEVDNLIGSCLEGGIANLILHQANLPQYPVDFSVAHWFVPSGMKMSFEGQKQ